MGADSRPDWGERAVVPLGPTVRRRGDLPSGRGRGACFLDLDLDGGNRDDFNRWGWTIGPLAQGSYTFDLYAGAGRCDRTNGTYVGSLTVAYCGGTATVTVTTVGSDPETNAGYNMVEAHLYVGGEILPRDVNGGFAVAPGRYPDVAGELRNVLTTTFEVSGLSGDVHVVAHATVAGFPQ